MEEVIGKSGCYLERGGEGEREEKVLCNPFKLSLGVFGFVSRLLAWGIVALTCSIKVGPLTSMSAGSEGLK